MGYLASEVISRITMKAALPEGRYTDDEILDAATRTMLSEVVPIVRSCHQEYYVTRTSVAVVAGTYSYTLPTRSMGQGLREVKYNRSSKWFDLRNVPLERMDNNLTGMPSNSLIENNQLVVCPTPSDSVGELLMWYYRRPSKLVVDAEGFRVSTIDTNTNTITVVGTPTWTTSNTFDVISPYSGYTVKTLDTAISSISSSDIVVSSLPTGLVAGDYLCLSGETVLPELPDEAQEILIALTGANLLFEMGDRENGAILRADGERLASAYLSIVNPRIEGAPAPFLTSLV